MGREGGGGGLEVVTNGGGIYATARAVSRCNSHRGGCYNRALFAMQKNVRKELIWCVVFAPTKRDDVSKKKYFFFFCVFVLFFLGRGGLSY